MGHHAPRKSSGFPLSLAEFPAALPRAVCLLEDELRRVLVSFWAEPSRSRAQELARALAGASSLRGLKRSSRLFRSLESLLSMPVGDAFAIRIPLSEKLIEIVCLLKEEARAQAPHGRRFGQ
jgi:hypothetical protein